MLFDRSKKTEIRREVNYAIYFNNSLNLWNMQRIIYFYASNSNENFIIFKLY